MDVYQSNSLALKFNEAELVTLLCAWLYISLILLGKLEYSFNKVWCMFSVAILRSFVNLLIAQFQV